MLYTILSTDTEWEKMSSKKWSIVSYRLRFKVHLKHVLMVDWRSLHEGCLLVIRKISEADSDKFT